MAETIGEQAQRNAKQWGYTGMIRNVTRTYTGENGKPCKWVYEFDGGICLTCEEHNDREYCLRKGKSERRS